MPDEGGRSDGSVRVSDEAVAQIACAAAEAVDGARVLGGGHGLGDLLSRRPGGRGVRVELDAETAVVELTLGVRYGVRIPEVARQVQEAVRDGLGRMTGLTVRAVHIHVAQVDGPGAGGEREGGGQS